MNLLRFLLKYSRAMVIATSLLAFLSGACNAALIALVNAVLNRHGAASSTLLVAFVAVGLGRLLTNFAAQVSLARFAQRNTARLRMDLTRKILSVPLRQLEEIGTPRLLVALTDDVMEITQAMLAIPAFSVNLAVLIGGGVYLGWLSPKVLLAVVVFILMGAAAYRWLMQSGFNFLRAARTEEDRLFQNFRALTEGVKELKLHRERRGVFLERNIQDATAAYEKNNVAAELRFIVANNWSHLLFFTLIAMILFFLPRMEAVPPGAMTGYVIATLYLLGPLSGLLGSLAVFGRADVALEKVGQLGLVLDVRSADDCGASSGGGHRAPLETLELIAVTHCYRCKREDEHFILGPVNMTFRPGESVFLVGGNGSGKSTLAKVIAGLYPPATGEIRLNGRRVGDDNRDDYRQNFSTVFADFYLFDNLLGLNGAGLDARATSYLEQLHLNDKVAVRNGAFSTINLSQGQRKRLALLTAYLEDRPFYLFDEWASDQDPPFKEVFYHQLLPELKAANKAILVITHDDRYFHLADRLIKLDYGQVVSDQAPLEAAEAMNLAVGNRPGRVFSTNGR